MQTLGQGHVDGFNVGKQLFLGVFLVVSLSRDSQSHSVGDTLDTSRPEGDVEAGVQADVGGLHVQGGELLDRLDSGGRSLLEVGAVESLVEVDGVLTGDNVGQSHLGFGMGAGQAK